MTTEAILRELKRKEERAKIEETKAAIWQLRILLNNLRVIYLKDSSFNSNVFIKKYKV
jgi:hypothetical protein